MNKCTHCYKPLTSRPTIDITGDSLIEIASDVINFVKFK